MVAERIGQRIRSSEIREGGAWEKMWQNRLTNISFWGKNDLNNRVVLKVNEWVTMKILNLEFWGNL